MPHTLTITDAEARDGGMHLRETRARRADAETWLAHKVAQLAARVVLGDATVYRTASGRLEIA